MRSVLSLTAMAVVGTSLLTAAPKSAEAAQCYYRLHQHGKGQVTGKLGLQGYAVAAKLKWACNRAENECNRRLKRARKKGRLPRGGPRDFRCVRTTTT